MINLDYRCTTPEHNLALDDALLEWVETTEKTAVLRFWEPAATFVVLGRSRKLELEVNQEQCQKDSVKILRRQSGGGTILQTKGCLNFSVILPIKFHPELADIKSTTCFALNKNLHELQKACPELTINGTSDFTIYGKKIAGHAQKRLRNSVLFHGSFLVSTDINTISTYLSHPEVEPAYRSNRSHKDFLTTLNLSMYEIKSHILNAWPITETSIYMPEFCLKRMTEISIEKYENTIWNYQH